MTSRECKPGRAPRPSWRMRMGSLRAFSLPVSVLPVFVAAAVALPAGAWRWDLLIASAVGVGLLHLTGNLLNDYFDFLSGVDRREQGDENRPGRQLVRGELTPRDVLVEAMLCAILAALPAAYLLWRVGSGVLAFAAAAGAMLYAYTGPPLRLKYRAMGELLVFLNFGPALMLGAAYVQTGALDWRAGLLSIPVGLATTAILTGNNVRDRQEDAEAGITTLAHLGTGRFARWLYVGLVTAGTGLPAVFAAMGIAPWPLLFAPVLLALVARPMRSILRGRRIPDIDARTARFESAVLLAVLASFVVEGLA